MKPPLAQGAVLVVELAPSADAGTDLDTPDPRAGFAALRPVIAQHDGTVVDLPGRRVAVHFSSAFAAVNCAVALQRSPAGDSGLRIGVDFGDVISNGETMVGDGVYVASRLQDMADPGHVCVSGAIYDRVTGRVGVDFEALGAQSLSDRAEAVRIYRVEPDPKAVDAKANIGAALLESDQIPTAIAPELAQAGEPKNVNAERQTQRGFWLYNRNNQEDTVKAQRRFWAALDADPNYAAAAAGIAMCLLQERQRGWSTDPGRALLKADAVARRAVAIRPKYAFAHVVLGEISLFRNDLDKAAAEATETLTLQPALADGHSLRGLVQLCEGKLDDAVAALEHALVRDPSERQQLKVLPALAAAYYQLRRYEVAERVALRAFGLARGHWLARQILAASRGQLGYESGSPIIEGIRNDEPLLTRRDFAARLYYREAARRQHVEQGLRQAGWGDFEV
jgi:tetratricopeptide (TPR) repeat protein